MGTTSTPVKPTKVSVDGVGHKGRGRGGVGSQETDHKPVEGSVSTPAEDSPWTLVLRSSSPTLCDESRP